MGDTDILGILSIVFAFLIAPVGLVLGIIGIVQNRKSSRSITLPLIGLVISVLALPVFFIFVGTLAYFGVTDPSGFTPESCTFSAGILCTEYAYNPQSESFEFELTNGLGRTLEIQGLTVSGADIDGSCTSNEAVRLPNGASENFTVADCVVDGDVARGDVTLTYVYEGGVPTPKEIPGQVSVRI